MGEKVLREKRNFSRIVYTKCPSCKERSFVVCARCRAGDRFELVDDKMDPLQLKNNETSSEVRGAECHCGYIVEYINCECNRKLPAESFHYNQSFEKADKKDGIAKKVLSEREIKRQKEDRDGQRMIRAFIVCAVSGFVSYWAILNHYSLIALPTWWLFIASGVYSIFRLIVWFWRG